MTTPNIQIVCENKTVVFNDYFSERIIKRIKDNFFNEFSSIDFKMFLKRSDSDINDLVAEYQKFSDSVYTGANQKIQWNIIHEATGLDIKDLHLENTSMYSRGSFTILENIAGA